MPGELRPEGESSPPASLSRALAILVAVNDAERRQRVIDSLDGERFSLQISGTSPQPKTPEVIVTDESLASADLASFHALLMRGQVGVVLIARALPADVVLPADFTRRELRLACRLLAQVVSLRRQNQRLETLAATDTLTGLPNRRALEAQFALHAEQQGPLALALFDVDQFKRINAEQGYLHGDEVLAAIGKTLANQVREGFAARLGGDEFALLWPTADGPETFAFADQLRRTLGLAASLKATRPISASAGLAILTQPPTFAVLLQEADAALRRAKAAGGRQTQR